MRFQKNTVQTMATYQVESVEYGDGGPLGDAPAKLFNASS